MIPGILASTGRFLDVAALSNCALWLDASDASTITHSSGSVSQINDKSGNARHLTQGTGANQPRIDTHTQNGLAVLDFDGINDNLTLGSSGLGRNVAGVTIHVACYCERPFNGGSTYPLCISTNTSSAVRAGLQFGATDYKPGIGARRVDGDTFTNFSSPTSLHGGFAVYTAVLDYANSNCYIYVNGVLEYTNTSFFADGNTSDTASLETRVGALVGNLRNFRGKIGEIAVFHEAQPEALVANIASYLVRKWGCPEENLGKITWQTPVAIADGDSSLNTPGGQEVVYGWRFTAVSGTVNGITFAEASCDNEDGEATSGLGYTNSNSTLQTLLNSFEWKVSTNSSPSVHLSITLTGLTKGQKYAVRLFVCDGRTSPDARNRLQRFVDHCGNESESMRHGDFKYLVGEFIAAGPTQLITAKWISGGSSDAAIINLLVLRRFT